MWGGGGGGEGGIVCFSTQDFTQTHTHTHDPRLHPQPTTVRHTPTELYIIIYADFLNLYHQNRYDKNNRIQDLTFDLRHVIVFLFFYLFGYLSFPNLVILEMFYSMLAV